MSSKSPEFKFLGSYVINTEPTDYHWANGSSSGYAAHILSTNDNGFLLSGTGRREVYSANLHTRLVKLNESGQLDLEFGDRGVSRFTYPESAMDSIRGTYQDAQGRFVTLGHIAIESKVAVTLDTPHPGFRLALSRFLEDGSLDSSFGENGHVLLGLSEINANSFAPESLQFLSDGKILLLSHAAVMQSNKSTANHMVLIRLNADGSLDTTFNGTGQLHMPEQYGMFGEFSIGADDIISLTVKSIGGEAYLGPMQWSIHDFFVDMSGNVLGEPKVTEVNARFNNNFVAIRAFDIDESGQRLIVGDTGRVWFARRLDPNGNTDGSFNQGQDLLLPIPDDVTNILADQVIKLNDGGYLIEGRVWRPDTTNSLFPPYSHFLLKLSASGTVDTAFGKAGMVESGTNLRFPIIKELSDGSLIWGGSAQIELLRWESNVQASFAISRLTPDGRFDLDFGGALGLTARTMVWEGMNEYQQLSPFASVIDPDLDEKFLTTAELNYAGYRLEISRKSGVSASDGFSGMVGLVLTEGGPATLDGIHVGDVNSTSGTLDIVFNENATQQAINRVLTHIGYKYLSQETPSGAPLVTAVNPGGSGFLSEYRLIELAWQFHEPLDTASGTDTAISGQAVTSLLLTPMDDPATGTVRIEGQPAVGNTLEIVANLTDPDGSVELHNISWYADDEWILGQGNGTDKLVLSEKEIGKTITVKTYSVDEYGGFSGAFEATVSEPVSPALVKGQFPGTKFWNAPNKAPSDVAIKPAITLPDVLESLKLYLGKPVSAPSPYKYLAADIDGNGAVNLSDVLTILKIYLGKPTNVQPEWVFVSKTQVELEAARFTSAVIPVESNTFEDVKGSNIEFVGVLRGDVNGSWTDI